ncbi:MAG TPA: hypothetical protein VMZ52_04990 [Bryobacteraceae bacterium]|nr:hypothetical protein [Bryobacteraceae bacterium]
MNSALCMLLVSLSAFGQAISSSSYDLNGKRVEGVRTESSQAGASSERRVLVKNGSGRSVPIEHAQEKVVSDSGGLRIVERLVQHYDEDGKPTVSDKVRVEEQKNADGSGNVLTVVQRRDLNGNYQVAERSRAQGRKSRETITTSVAVERPGLSGSLELVEKKEESRRETKAGDVTEVSTLYRRNANGGFQEAAKETLERKVANGKTLENTASYVVRDGRSELVRQTVTRSEKAPDGSEQKSIDVFEGSPAGRVVSESDPQPKLREQQVIEKKMSPAGWVESLSVRRPLPSDPARLGDLQKVGETVCSGHCK